MDIRRLLAVDADRFQALRLQALRDSPGSFSSSYAEECETPLSAIGKFLTDHGVLGAFAGEELVGVIAVGRETLHNTRHKGFIRAMYVAPAQRGRGIAKRLMTEALATLQSLDGVRQVTLAVTASNTAAIALYESMGFVSYGREPDALLIDGVFYEDIHMMRHLDVSG
jgi:ribosomal protein S18 acetylase RimI-like enzyme